MGKYEPYEGGRNHLNQWYSSLSHSCLCDVSVIHLGWLNIILVMMRRGGIGGGSHKSAWEGKLGPPVPEFFKVVDVTRSI